MSSLVSKIVAACHRPTRWLRRGLRWLLVAVLGLWFLLLGLWLILHWAILPNVDRWRPEIEARATQWLGSSLRIGAIQVRTGGWIPVLELQRVELLDPAGRVALHLPRVSAALSARSFLGLQPRLEQLYLEAPEIELRLDRQRRLWIAGQPLRDEGADADPALADWLLRQYELAIRGGKLRWVDETRPAAPPLELSGVDLLLRNTLRRHELRIDASPPAEWGRRFSLRARAQQPLLARPSDWRRWKASLYAELPQARVAGLSRHVALPFELREGDGALRLWGELSQGALQQLDLDLALRAVRLRLSPQVEPLELGDLQTRLGWQRQDGGTQWSAQGLSFHLQDAQGRPRAWAPSRVALNLRHAGTSPVWQLVPAGALQGGRLQAEQLDLGLLALLAERLPLGAALHRELQQRQPSGRLAQLDAQWQGSLDAPQRWRVDASAEGLAWQALQPSEPGRPGQPGLQGVSLSLNASERGGQARLALRQGALDWPGFLPEAVALEQAQLPLSWQRQDDGRWRLSLRQARLRNADGQIELDGRWQGRLERWDPADLGEIDLQAALPQLEVRALPRYLPLPLDIHVRQYLADALQSGLLRQARMTLRGELARFPFADGGGSFRVAARAAGLRFAYLPSHPADAGRAAHESPWPALDDLHGELLFEGPALRILKARARVGGLLAEGMQAQIPHLGHDPLLKIDGRWSGSVEAALQFVRDTPVGAWTAHALAAAQGSGQVSGQLSFQIPLLHPQQTQVQGAVLLAGNELRLSPALPAFRLQRLRADFTEHSLRLSEGRAQWLGGELRLDGGTQADGALRLRGEGQLSAEGLRQASEWAPLPAWAQAMQGQTAYQFNGLWQGERHELEFRSGLQGLALALPAPLDKPADAVWPLRLTAGQAQAGLESWRLQLERGGSTLAQGQLQLTARAPVRAGLRLGGGEAQLPEQGLGLQIALPRVDLDAWRARLAQLGVGGGAGTAAALVALQTPQLQIAGRQLRAVDAQLRIEAGAWKLRLDSEQAAGQAEWRPAAGGQGARLSAHLRRLSLPRSEVERVEQELDDTSAGLPGLDVVVEAFELRGKALGRLELQAEPAAAGQAWALRQLSLRHADALLAAQGHWDPRSHRTELDWSLKVENSGNWLAALGMPDTVRGGKGELKGSLGWLGSPLSPNVGALDGSFSVQLGGGQFLKAEPGVARLLGILSLQSLPRRLFFDWRDVFSEGFAFDDFGGDVRIEQGIARSSNLRMRGPHASVLMDGSADLRRETADLRILVVPELNAGGASLAYAAVNPVVGLTTFLAQLLLRKPLAAANTQQFHLSGPWDDPKVLKIEAPASNPPAPPASAASARP